MAQVMKALREMEPVGQEVGEKGGDQEGVCTELGASATKVLKLCFFFHSFYRKRPR